MFFLQFLHIFIVILSVFVNISQAQITSNGTCPPIAMKPFFNISGILGIWHELNRYDNPFQGDSECVSFEFLMEDQTNSNRVTATNVGIYFQEDETPGIRQTSGIIVPFNPDVQRPSGKLKVQWFGPEEAKSDFLVLGTDYNNYLVTYSCKQTSSETYQELAWIMSRQRTLPRDFGNQVYKLLWKNNIKREVLRSTDQGKRCDIIYGRMPKNETQGDISNFIDLY